VLLIRGIHANPIVPESTRVIGCLPGPQLPLAA